MIHVLIMCFTVKPIGKIHTPYKPGERNPPFQSVEDETQTFYIDVYPKHTKRLEKLELFTYIYLLYYLDQSKKKPKELVSPPWTKNANIGLFASRSPNRINPIGLSVVKLKEIKENRIIISGIDAFDNTPLLDIKPYIKDLDSKTDANYGWLENEEDSKKHLQLHIKGIPHKH